MQKTAGFCFGVQRAVDKVYELIDSCQDRLFTLGPIIHNEEVVNDLEKKGVRVASEEELKTLPKGQHRSDPLTRCWEKKSTIS